MCFFRQTPQKKCQDEKYNTDIVSEAVENGNPLDIKEFNVLCPTVFRKSNIWIYLSSSEPLYKMSVKMSDMHVSIIL